MARFKYPTIVLILISLIYSCKKEDELSPVENYVSYSDILLTSYTTFNSTSGRLWVLDHLGNVRQQIPTTDQPLNFRRWNVNGKIRYTYHLHDKTAYHIPGVGYIPGKGMVLDENYHVIDEVKLIPFGSRTPSDPAELDGHDFIYLADGHYVTMAYFEKTVSNIPASLNPVAGCKVVAPIIQEVQNGQVVWEWDGTNYPEFYETSATGNKFSDAAQTDDYMHINSMIIDPRDNNLICSFRNMDQILKIERNTGNILWRLGGTNSDFQLSNYEKPLRQHDAKLVDNNGTLIMLDNGDASLRPYSRIMEYSLDESSMTVKAIKVTNLPGNLFAQYMGSVQKLPSTYFVGGGSTPRIMEFKQSDSSIIFEKQLSSTTYRAYKYF